ncbi:hypothetical protein [Streptomyces albus]|uniref:hypothetical protein n=1 Tax=Streptomyces albus TaxID=1888 RepID=UPI0010BECBCF|nr:hypothetical protein [Streptomyces albus]
MELKTLRDAAGKAGLVKPTCEAAGIHRTTYYAWLSGKQIPNVDALSLVVKAWGGDPQHWLHRRQKAVEAVVQASVHEAGNSSDPTDFVKMVDGLEGRYADAIDTLVKKGGWMARAVNHPDFDEAELYSELRLPFRKFWHEVGDKVFLMRLARLSSFVTEDTRVIHVARGTATLSPDQVEDILLGRFHAGPAETFQARISVVNSITRHIEHLERYHNVLREVLEAATRSMEELIRLAPFSVYLQEDGIGV